MFSLLKEFQANVTTL